MRYFSFLFSLLCFVLASASLCGQSLLKIDDTSRFEQGLFLWENESPEKALLLWRQEIADFQSKGFFDPRIGFEFIRLATEHELDLYYDEASTFHQLALKSPAFYQFKNDYIQEAQRIIPMLAPEEQAKWQQWINQGDSLFINEMLLFWEINDPLLSTRRNERLIEHWRRIAYARAHFTKRKNSPYQTDDRGTVYVRLGQPASKQHARAKIDKVTDPISSEEIRLQSGIIVWVDVELWRYHRKGDKYPIYYLFGENDTDGKPYGRYESVMDLVPSTGVEFRTGRGISIQLPEYQKKSLVRLAALEELQRFDNVFSKMYFDVEALINAMGTNRGLALASSMVVLDFNSQQVRQAAIQQRRLPERSLEFPEQTKLHIDTKQFRFLDETSNTRVVLATFLSVEGAFTREKLILGIGGLDTPSLNVATTLMRVDEKGRSLGRQVRQFVVFENEPGLFLSYSFILNQLGPKVIINQELYNPNRATIIADSLSFYNKRRKMLIGSTGSLSIERPQPLNRYGFEISDIMVGKKQEVNIESDLPFVPIVSNTFNKEDDMLVYFEAYQIPEANYTIQASFKRLRWFGKTGTQTSIRLTYQKYEGIDKQYFAVPLEEFQPGEYELNLTFRSGKHTVNRRVEFQILKSSEEKEGTIDRESFQQ